MAALRSFPWVPTLMVAIALPILIGFGIWQLQRAQWKEALLADLARNAAAPILDAGDGPIPADAQFRLVRVTLACTAGPSAPRAGRSLDGRSGYSHLVRCSSGGERVMLDAGWSPRPAPVSFPSSAGVMEGRPVRTGDGGWVLVARTARPLLVPSAPPSTDTISNNHLSYAVQWFSFAAILATIYGLWLRRRLASLPPSA
jgi:cytochrome oxidase assembly protein ShyY1